MKICEEKILRVYIYTLSVEEGHIGAGSGIERAGGSTTCIADPAVAWTVAGGLVHGHSAVAVVVVVIVACADFDAVAEAVDEGFRYSGGAIEVQRVGEIAVFGEFEVGWVGSCP